LVDQSINQIKTRPIPISPSLVETNEAQRYAPIALEVAKGLELRGLREDDGLRRVPLVPVQRDGHDLHPCVRAMGLGLLLLLTDCRNGRGKGGDVTTAPSPRSLLASVLFLLLRSIEMGRKKERDH